MWTIPINRAKPIIMLLAFRAVSGIPYRGMSRHRARFFPDLVRSGSRRLFIPLSKVARVSMNLSGCPLAGFYSGRGHDAPPLIGLYLIGRQTYQVFPSATDETRIHGESPTVKGRAFFVSAIRDPQLINLRCYTCPIPFESRYKTIVYRSKAFLLCSITGHHKALIFLKNFYFSGRYYRTLKFFLGAVPCLNNRSRSFRHKKEVPPTHPPTFDKLLITTIFVITLYRIF